jgi:hypothetical protein
MAGPLLPYWLGPPFLYLQLQEASAPLHFPPPSLLSVPVCAQGLKVPCRRAILHGADELPPFHGRPAPALGARLLHFGWPA